MISPALGRSDSQGSPSRAEGWSPPCLDRFFLLGVCVGVAGTAKALLRQWAFLGGGALVHGSPPYSPHTHVFPPASSPSLSSSSLALFFLLLSL